MAITFPDEALLYYRECLLNRPFLASQETLNNMELEKMPALTARTDPNTTDVATIFSNIGRDEINLSNIPAIVAPPNFTIQLNTQTADLHALKATYPRQVHRYNLQTTARLALSDVRENVRYAITNAKRIKAAWYIIHNTPKKYHSNINELVRHIHTSRISRELQETTNIEDLSTYQNAVQIIDSYRINRNQFRSDKHSYGKMQAEYNQRAAMIRQKPSIPKEINTQEILEVLSQWDNVWGIGIKCMSEGLYIRVGLTNIIMEESSEESRYDEAKPIKLAPFYFTLILRNDGTFICPSRDNLISGLSGGNNMGDLSYDIHPHQLSDAPCFGSFGQTFIDLAIRGEAIALISGIIAFYSQYNSEDSAGVNARNYHPARIECPNISSDVYTDRMTSYFKAWKHYIVHESKLSEGLEQYLAYHDSEKHEHAPSINNTERCYHCEENEVGDDCGETWFSTYNGDRVCENCWDNDYCSDCERSYDNCCCSDE